MGPSREQSTPPEAGRWTAGAAARRLGMTTSTLRTWNHRYGVGPVQGPGTHRLYSEADLAQLEAVLRLVEAGTPPRAAVELVRASDGAREPIATTAAVPGTASALAAAAWELNATGLTLALATALRERGVVYTWQRLCRPALERLAREGLAKDQSAACMGAELVLANAATTALHQFLTTSRPVPDANPAVLLACPSGELHGLAPLVLQAALAEAGVATLMLGTAVADEVVLEAAGRVRPDCAALYAHRRENASVASLRSLTAAVPFVLAAGPGWADRRLPSGVAAANDLPTARRLLLARRPGRGGA